MQTSESNPIGHVTNPYVVGGAIIALKYRDGVVIGTDTLLSYGSLLSTKKIIQSIRMYADMKKSLITY